MIYKGNILFIAGKIGFCITNASNLEAWDYNENDHPSDIHLTSNEYTGDHLLGSTRFKVEEGKETKNAAVFDLDRRVAMLKVIITHIPENLEDLKINISDIPGKLSLTGKYSGTNTISKNITPPDANRVSETNILLFPPEKKATISLSSENLQFMTIEHTIDTILVNHVTEINIKLWPLTDVPQLEITNHIVNWEDKIITEDDWEVIVPDGPCTGTGNGLNLIRNGSFEYEFTGGIPLHWELDASSSDYTPEVTGIEEPVHAGSKAVMISPKSYLTQEIYITGGKCYQFKAHINSPHEDVEWAVWGTWKKGSTALTSQSSIIRTEQQNKTEGYIDAYQGQIFRAPETATKLLIEIKNYSDIEITEGLYIDDISVELVE